MDASKILFAVCSLLLGKTKQTSNKNIFIASSSDKISIKDFFNPCKFIAEISFYELQTRRIDYV